MAAAGRGDRPRAAGGLRAAAPPTSEAQDYSTKAEGMEVLAAVRDVLPGLPGWVQLVGSTDSLLFKMNFAGGLSSSSGGSCGSPTRARCMR